MSWYKTGTVAINNGSTTVTGSGTAWVDNVDVGEGILLPDGRTYEIVGVASNTSLTIGRAYLGSNSSGGAYEIQPFRGRIAGLTARASELLDSFQAVRDGIGAGLFPDGSAALPAGRFSNDQDTGFYRSANNTFSIAAGGALSCSFGPNGMIAPVKVADTNGTVLEVGRASSADVAIMTWKTAGTASLWIGQAGFVFGGASYGLFSAALNDFAHVTNVANGDMVFAGEIRPRQDNNRNIGSGALRWGVVYAGTGTINTSDEREKAWRGDLNAAELSAAKRIIAELGIYQWNDAVAEKGSSGARLHFGVRAQQAFAIMEDEGLDWRRYAWCCHDEWEEQISPILDAEGMPTGETRVTMEAGDRYGVRPDQLAFWLIAAQAAVQADLEARIAALEGA